MKFLYFNFQIPYLLKDSREIAGGAAVQWLSWISGFIANGQQFGLLTFKGAKTYIDKELGFDIVESYDPNKGIKKFRLIYDQFPKLLLAVKKYNPDFVIQSSATAHTGMLMLVSKFLGIPFIHRVAHDSHVDERLSTLVSSKEIFLYKLGLKFADYIITQNSYQYQKLKDKYPKKKIYILPNPYEDKEKSEILPRDKRSYIAWIGNFRKVKNLPALVSVAEKLPDIHFKIAGAELIADNETRKAIDNLKQLRNVQFLGYLKRAEIKPFLSKSITLLNTSYTEGFSNTFLEAWACGTPVVSTVNVNPDQIITTYNLGEISEDFDSLHNSLRKVINYNDSYYYNISLNCYNYVKENHDPKVLAEKFVSYLKF